MAKDTKIGVDLAKNVFQIHGTSMSGDVRFRKKLSRPQFPKFIAGHDRAVVAMEACGSANYWARPKANRMREANGLDGCASAGTRTSWPSRSPTRMQGPSGPSYLGVTSSDRPGWPPQYRCDEEVEHEKARPAEIAANRQGMEKGPRSVAS